MLDLAVLGLLREQPHHGYELKQRLAELGFWRVSFGSLYPAIRRLEKRGLIEALRNTGRRKAYRITDSGRVAFDEMLVDDPGQTEGDRRFQIRLAFFRYIEPALRIQTLQRRRRQLVDRLGASKGALRDATARRGSLDRYTRALMERSLRTTEADIEWLDELIAAERSSQPIGQTTVTLKGEIE
jgi:DNA-binding PadR family transcriptional regulator